MSIKNILHQNANTQPNTELLQTLQNTLPQYFDAEGNFKADKFEAELKANNIAEARDGYRLGFVGKDYARLLTGQASKTVIVPDIAHNALPENSDSQNVFITGNNLEALRHLQNAYKGIIKMIYIDPPYNTGKEFIYNDKFDFSDEKLKTTLGYTDTEIERLKSIQGKSSHSAWLTFMYPRLKIAQKLLTDDGVIFVSIDDNEQANLKLLMDDIFGEGNFVAKFDWRKKTGANDANDIAVITETILLYAKNHSFTIEKDIWARDENSVNQDRYRLSDEFVATRGKFYFDTLDRGGLQYSDSMNFGIMPPDNKEIYPNGRSEFERDGWIWKWSKEKVQWGLENKFLEFVKSDKSKNSEYTIKYKVYQNVDNEGNIRKNSGRAFSNLITDPINQIGNSDFSNLFGGKTYFSNPKPIGLILYFLKILKDKNYTILDFFAGSSTTAHAVMQLNAEDQGNRKYIMVQWDEKVAPKSEAENAGYKTIDQISRERIKRASKKIQSENPLFAKQGDWGFKHYRLVEPDVKTLDKIVEFNPADLDLFAKDMISPFAFGNESGLPTIMQTWSVQDGYDFNTQTDKLKLADYEAYYVKESAVLYLIDTGFLHDALKDLLNKIGKNELAVNTIVAYPYSFTFEQMRELKNNLKTNAETQITIIERY